MLSPLVIAQIETELTVTKTIPLQKVEEAKPHLVHQAVKDAIVQYSTEMDFDATAFEKKLGEKFLVHFKDYKKRRMTAKFGKNYDKTLGDEQKKAFLDHLEAQREDQYIKFTKFDRLLDSYAFRQIENDPATPHLWKAIVVIKLNREKLEKYNLRLLADGSKHYSRVHLISEINLLGMSWSELAVEKSAIFTDPLMSSWQKWLTTNQPINVEEITLCTGNCLEDFGEWQQMAQEERMTIPEHLLNSLWLRVSFNLRKVFFMAAINEWKFEWDGSVVLLDANTKKIISSHTLSSESKTWLGLGAKELNSALASAMYRSPLDALSKVVRKVQETPRLNQLNRLVVQGHRHLGDVLFLTDLLKKMGSKINLELSMDLFSRNEAQLLCFYQGEEKSFTDLLSQVKELKSSHSYSVVNEFTGVHHVLKLIAE
jgi:hypothetical protein